MRWRENKLLIIQKFVGLIALSHILMYLSNWLFYNFLTYIDKLSKNNHSANLLEMFLDIIIAIFLFIVFIIIAIILFIPALLYQLIHNLSFTKDPFDLYFFYCTSILWLLLYLNKKLLVHLKKPPKRNNKKENLIYKLLNFLKTNKNIYKRSYMYPDDNQGLVQVEKIYWKLRRKCTIERRIVLMHKNHIIRFISSNKNIWGLFGPLRGFDTIASIDMGIKEYKINEDDSITTSDGITVGVTIKIFASLKQDNDKLSRIIKNENSEIGLFKLSIFNFMQKYVYTIDSAKISQNLYSATEYLKENINNLEFNSDTCFSIKDITVSRLSLGDKDIDDILKKGIKEKVSELNKKEISPLKKINVQLDHESKIAETKSSIELDKIKTDYELDIHKKRQLVESELKIREIINKIKLLKQPEGKIALYPQEEYSRLEKELELEFNAIKERNEWNVELLKRISDIDFIKGQLDMAEKLIPKDINVKLNDKK